MAESSEAGSEALGQLTAFEKYMVWDDHADAPMTPVVQVDFDSALDADDLHQAFDAALKRHPLLRARVSEASGGLRWSPSHELPQIEMGLPPTRYTPIDLHAQTGLRCWLAERAHGKSLFLQWHHACCDGVGMRAFLIDLLLEYAEIRTGVSLAKTPNYSHEQLANRGDIDGFRPKQAIGYLQKLRNAYYFHFQPPVALACRAREQSTNEHLKESSESLGRLLTCEISGEHSRLMREKCRKNHISPNSVALALLFLQCDEWNKRLPGLQTGQRFRLLVPFDLRTSDCSQLSAANRMSFAFVGRTRRQIENALGDFSAFAAGIHEEMQYNRNTMLPLDFLRGLELAARSPRALKGLLAASNRMATAVLTYTGDVARGIGRKFPLASDGSVQIGDCRLLRIVAAPPVRRNTHVAIGICQNWGKFLISAAVSDAFGLESGRAFLDEYQARWRDYASRSG
ncbi:MAG TPA: hypothetical protein DDW52_19325 [Planctomycetaceae bacterium]|nr:hypothetical protein [Planctomycetaceae bacterium]